MAGPRRIPQPGAGAALANRACRLQEVGGVQTAGIPRTRPASPNRSRTDGRAGNVRNYTDRKAVFDQDPLRRKQHGVTNHRIYQDSEDPKHLMLSLEFRSDAEANTFRELVQPVWEVSGAGQVWLLHDAEAAQH